MTKEILKNQNSAPTELATSQEFVIEKLLPQFHASIDLVVKESGKHAEMIEVLKAHNPDFTPIQVETKHPKAEVLANVVAGIYAPMIHGFATTIVRNIKEGKLSNVVIAPPRDAIPLAVAIEAQAEIQGCELQVMMPHVNRNTAGIANNQKGYFIGRSPHLDLLLDQAIFNMNGSTGAIEVETGIYGTTSLIMAEAFKARKLKRYSPIKFYGLGPNISYVHAVLSDGKEWIAEVAEAQGLVEVSEINGLMVLLDTIEELGMEKFYQGVERLQVNENGLVEPIIVPVSDEEREIASVTNKVIAETAFIYRNITPGEVKLMLGRVPCLVEYAQQGFPLTLTEPIPSMDSKEEHFSAVRKSKLFDYPDLLL